MSEYLGGIDQNDLPVAPVGVVAARIWALRGRIVAIADRGCGLVIRTGLALVFGWFGALKVAGVSPVADLLAGTLPFLDPQLAVRGLGVVEVLLALALVAFRRSAVVPLIMIGHLVGTFLTFVMVPAMMFVDGNPLLISTDGEFVTKNVILIGALLVLVARAGRAPRSAE